MRAVCQHLRRDFALGWWSGFAVIRENGYYQVRLRKFPLAGTERIEDRVPCRHSLSMRRCPRPKLR